jgi:hypothetical protein
MRFTRTFTTAPLQMAAAVEKNLARLSILSHPFGDLPSGARRGLVNVTR